jgi:hypothetical protein
MKLWIRSFFAEGWYFYLLIGPVYGWVTSQPLDTTVVISIVGAGLVLVASAWQYLRGQPSTRGSLKNERAKAKRLGAVSNDSIFTDFDPARPLLAAGVSDESKIRYFLLTRDADNDPAVWHISAPRRLPFRRIGIIEANVPDSRIRSRLKRLDLQLLPQDEASDSVWRRQFS